MTAASSAFLVARLFGVDAGTTKMLSIGGASVGTYQMTSTGVRTTLYILLFAIGFYLTSSVTTIILRRAGIDDLDIVSARIKSAHKEKNPNLLFIGTSRLIEGVNPEVFDHTTDEAGLHTRSFNLGIPGANLIEMLAMTRHYIATQPCCMKYAIVEPEFAFLEVIKMPNSARAIRFATPANALDLWRFAHSMSEQPAPPITPMEYTSNLLVATLRNLSNIGLVHMLRDQALTNYTLQPNVRGFIGQPGSLAQKIESDPRIGHAYTETLKFLDDFNDLDQSNETSSAAHRHTAAAIRNRVSDYQFDRLQQLLGILQAHDVAVMLLRTPQLAHVSYNIAFANRYLAQCSGPPLLDLGRPRDNEDLFKPENRVDMDHMNMRGSEILTKIIAQKFVEFFHTKRVAMTRPMVCQN